MKELEELIKQEQEEVLQRDTEMLAKGYTHRVTWWNHRTMGDDIQTDMYFGCDPTELTPNDGKAWKEWRRIKYESEPGGGDYKIFALNDVVNPTLIVSGICSKCGGTELLENKNHRTLFCRACGAVQGETQTSTPIPSGSLPDT